jgi:hypothetical protein
LELGHPVILGTLEETTMRFVLICLLLTGCAAGSSLTMPGKTPREAVSLGMAKQLESNPATPAQKACVVEFMNKNLSDDQMKLIDAALATGGTNAAYHAVIPLAVEACIK